MEILDLGQCYANHSCGAKGKRCSEHLVTESGVTAVHGSVEQDSQ